MTMLARNFRNVLMLGTAFTGAAIATPTLAQDTGAGNAGDIIVTAQRIEQRLQDVPISITVFNQQQLANKNVTSATDLATYTPSLAANNNFGSDNTTFAIRGFAQDVSTAPSVGVYFGDVVKPRGASNGQPVGDGATHGDFFDLQNVQVLKGPQGTLFGRNTTGGSVLFVPQKPKDNLEGYIQGGIGNYDMRRLQGVLNVPLSDTFLVRAGFDHMKRDGYLKNQSGIGPDRFGDVDYWAARLSVVAELTPDLENYTIASWERSKNNGSVNKLVAYNASQGFGAFAAGQAAVQGTGFYNVMNAIGDAGIKTQQWQVINTTTWTASDALTIKNIASYAEIKQTGVNPIFGNLFYIPDLAGNIYPTDFQTSASPTGGDIAHESTFTEELRFQGTMGEDKFQWQAGAYLESALPLSTLNGSQSPGFASCSGNIYGGNTNCTDSALPIAQYGLASRVVANPTAFGLPAGTSFADALAFAQAAVPHIGSINYTTGRTSFRDVGLYAQGTYKFSDQLKLTGGFRYTWDRETIDTVQKVYTLAPPPAYGVTGSSCLQPAGVSDANCESHFKTTSQKPTWLIDLDYTPTRDILLYGKYARGYRSATIVPVIPVATTNGQLDYTLNYVKPEKVDFFEIGAKTSWRGPVSGSFNIAGFYNKFSNQQLQVGFLAKPGQTVPQTAAPVNAGKSKIYGIEVEATLSPVHGLDFNLGYTYLRTRIDEVLPLPTSEFYNTQAAFTVGDPEVLSPKHKLALGATYTLPLPESVGQLSIGGSMTYRSKMLVNYIDRGNSDPNLAKWSYLPSLTLVDASVNWNNIAGSPIDAQFFVTNLTKEKYYTYVPGLGSEQLGFENASVGEPRMYGISLKYHFGS